MPDPNDPCRDHAPFATQGCSPADAPEDGAEALGENHGGECACGNFREPRDEEIARLRAALSDVCDLMVAAASWIRVWNPDRSDRADRLDAEADRLRADAGLST